MSETTTQETTDQVADEQQTTLPGFDEDATDLEETPTAREYPVMVPGFEEVGTAWWDAVAEVHEVLLAEDANLDQVSGAFNRELRARWEYARTLHERGYLVPEYLAERVPVAPLWPLPDRPVPARSVAQAA